VGLKHKISTESMANGSRLRGQASTKEPTIGKGLVMDLMAVRGSIEECLFAFLELWEGEFWNNRTIIAIMTGRSWTSEHDGGVGMMEMETALGTRPYLKGGVDVTALAYMQDPEWTITQP
jgi:hypothetical protein